MGFEKFENDLNDDKYRNEDYIVSVLEDGDDTEFNKVRQLQGWTEDEADLYRHFSRVRRATLDNMKIEYERRLAENPEPTADELSLGIHIEKIEPQVREAVLSLRNKGYSPYYSGFEDWAEEQVVRLEGDSLSVDDIEKLSSALSERGAVLKVAPDEISFKMEREASLPELKEIWDIIVAAVVDLGHRAPDCQKFFANSFRERFKGEAQ